VCAPRLLLGSEREKGRAGDPLAPYGPALMTERPRYLLKIHPLPNSTDCAGNPTFGDIPDPSR
jgi:hypothetical protein